MGIKTRAQLISEALELAGDTSLVPRAQMWMDMALLPLYTGAPWSFCNKRFTVSKVAGNTSIAIGNGGITPLRIFRIKSVSYIFGSQSQGELELINDDPTLSDDAINNALIKSARPYTAYVNNSGDPFAWTILFNAPIDKGYTFSVQTHYIPDPLTSDNQKPIYPNDDTIIHSLYVAALIHQQDQRRFTEEQIRRGKIQEDRVTYLNAAAQSPNIGLSSRFSGGGRVKSWLDE
jgi:hypothetical protein